MSGHINVNIFSRIPKICYSYVIVTYVWTKFNQYLSHWDKYSLSFSMNTLFSTHVDMIYTLTQWASSMIFFPSAKWVKWKPAFKMSGLWLCCKTGLVKTDKQKNQLSAANEVA